MSSSKKVVQAVTVVDLLFMKEISQVITFCSKSLQRFDVLSFEVMSDMNKLKKRLFDAKEAFGKKKFQK